MRRALLALRVPPNLLAPLARREGTRNVLASTAYWRGARRALGDRDTFRRLTQGTTILMYHALGAKGESPSRFVVPRRRFERQMRRLARRRPVLGLAELLEHRRTHRLPPAGAVVVTFDDGYRDTRTLAHPVLRRHGLPATLFLVSSFMGASNEWDSDAPLTGRPLVSWDDARELHRDGFELGGHTRTHPVLPELAPEELDREIGGSRSDLAEALGEPPEAFAYPYGRWSDEVAEAVRRAGFACALTVKAGRNGPATPPYKLRRAEVRGTDSRLRFWFAVRFGDADFPERVRRRVRP